MPKKNDFIIVGGGLVGCLASLILSKKNYTICLVEKKTFKHIISDYFTPLSLTINTIQFLKKNNFLRKTTPGSGHFLNLKKFTDDSPAFVYVF